MVVVRVCSFFCKQKTAYEIVSGDWSSDVCSSDLLPQGTQRAGEVVSRTTRRLTGLDAYTEGEDVTRYTVPHGINSQYWRASGGTDGGSIPSLSPLPARLAAANQYVQAWSCRGSFFAASV